VYLHFTFLFLLPCPNLLKNIAALKLFTFNITYSHSVDPIKK